MTWKDLNPQNIIEIKILYCNYLHKNIGNPDRFSFEEYIENVEQCAMCGEYDWSDNLIDTEGMINGGIGLVCESCRENM